MAKAQDIDIDPCEPYGHAGARIVRARADELISEAENVLDTDDIERVHAMRVASRRLRAVLEIFAACFPKKEYERVLRDVKAIADALGERRDPDVHIAALEEFAGKVASAQQPGVQRLVEEQRGRQAHGNEILAAALERMRARDLHGRLHALADHAVGTAGEAEAPEDGDADAGEPAAPEPVAADAGPIAAAPEPEPAAVAGDAAADAGPVATAEPAS